jgi:hypothetical protein
MAKKKKRDSSYLLQRLERDYPAIHAKYKAGDYSSVRQAASAAGLIRLPTNIDHLKRAWKKATHPEQVEFAKWVRARMPNTGTPAPAPIADANGYLLPAVRQFIRDWLTTTKSRPARILEAIGDNRYDYTFSQALDEKNPSSLKKERIDKLHPWLVKQRYR